MNMREQIQEILKASLYENRLSTSDYRYADKELEKLKDRDDIYIQMVEIEKSGINPLPKHHASPIGIYVYPLKQIWSDRTKFINIPYAFSRPYINVYQIDNEHVIDVTDYTIEMFKQDAKKLFKYIKNKYNISVTRYKQEKMINDTLAVDSERTMMSYLFSFITGLIYGSGLMSNEMNSRSSDTKINSQLLRSWISGAMLRYLGYAVVTDKNGTGTIHSNEPTQAIILMPKVAKLLMRLDNKKYHLKIKDINKSNDEEIKELLKTATPRNKQLIISALKNVSYDLQKHIVDEYGWPYAEYINDLSDDIAIYIIKEFGDSNIYKMINRKMNEDGSKLKSQKLKKHMKSLKTRGENGQTIEYDY